MKFTRNRVQFEVNQAFLQYNGAKSKLVNALQERKLAVESDLKSAKGIIGAHGGEVELIDEQVNYAKALIYLGKVAGMKKSFPL